MRKYLFNLSIILVVVILLSTVYFSACKESPQKEKRKSFLKIGVILPLTGPLSFRGQEEKKAIELASADFNQKQNESSVSLIFEDSQSKPLENTTETLLNKEHVSAFIASTAPVSRAISYVANKNKIIMAFLTSDSTIQRLSPYIFRLYESKEAEAEQIARYFAGKNKTEQIVVLFANQPEINRQITDYLIPKFTQGKINVAFYEPYDLWKKDFGETVERIKHSGCKHLLILGLKENYRPIFEELSRQKLSGKIEVVTGINLILSEDSLSKLFEGTIIAAPQYVFQKNEKAKLFEQRFLSIYGHAPSLDAAFAYDAFSILSEGLTEGLVTGRGNAETVSYRTTNRKHEGILGNVAVDNEGGLSVPMGMGMVQKGAIVPLQNNEKNPPFFKGGIKG